MTRCPRAPIRPMPAAPQNNAVYATFCAGTWKPKVLPSTNSSGGILITATGSRMPSRMCASNPSLELPLPPAGEGRRVGGRRSCSGVDPQHDARCLDDGVGALTLGQAQLFDGVDGDDGHDVDSR